MKASLTILFLLFSILCQTGYAAEVSVAKPSLVIFIAHNVIKERDNKPLPVHIWFSNDSDSDLNNVRIHIDSPDFFDWYTDSRLNNNEKLPLELGTVPAHSTVNRQIYGHLTPQANVGEAKLLFTALYTNNKNRQSSVNHEKNIMIEFVGVNQILGIPLSLAGIIVPGALFLILLSIFNVPFASKFQTDQKTFFFMSFIISVTIIFLSSILKSHVSLLEYIDISSEIKLIRFVFLSFIGALLGLLVGYGYKCYIMFKFKNCAFNPEDTIPQLIRKSLKLNPKYAGNGICVKLKNGEEYVGSHYARDINGNIYLFASFKFEWDEIERKKLSGNFESAMTGDKVKQTAESISYLTNISEEKSVEIALNQGIRLVQEGGKRRDIKENCLYWGNEEVSTIQTCWEDNRKLLEVI
jgi:small nuclear ribonucleoprotein (snRNP)-like protein